MQEYPRPTLRRDSFLSLDGTWLYAITRKPQKPKKFDGNIRVPFSPEAPLSGVNRKVRPYEYLWYRKEFQVEKVHGMRWILHFGAVDQIAFVYINNILVQKHVGGYTPFSVDITPWIQKDNTVEVMVKDFTDSSYLARGKQSLKPGGMFYTGQSGIWQSVWLEEVPREYIQNIVYTPIYDEEAIQIRVDGNQDAPVVIVIGEGEERITFIGKSNQNNIIKIQNMKSWSPDNPYLYPVEITFREDKVKSYFAMRKIEIKKDGDNIPRVYLNNEACFQKGVIDQGYWQEGLMTPASDWDFIRDIQNMKDLGFNMIRKHVKIEPQRWYYHCDRLGMMVWQDMINGGEGHRPWFITYMATLFEWTHISLKNPPESLTGRKKKNAKLRFIREMKDTIKVLYNHPSIVCWTIFNEGWGQFETNFMTDIVRKIDASRLIDQASGWFDQKGGDFRSIHNYFLPLKIKQEANRVAALTEFGGYSYSMKGHRTKEKTYGYRIYKSKKALTKAYESLMKREVIPQIEKGLSVVIYTQLSDIEEETNGIYTYDREELKIEREVVLRCNNLLKY